MEGARRLDIRVKQALDEYTTLKDLKGKTKFGRAMELYKFAATKDIQLGALEGYYRWIICF